MGTDRETILIVEDDFGVARLEEIHLKRAGYAVSSVATSQEAMERVLRGGIDLMVLDYALPGGATGLDFYQELKRVGCDLPVIMVTGVSDDIIVIKAFRAGVSDFVTKSMAYLDYLPEAVGYVLSQVNTRKALAKSEARLVSIIATAMDAILTVDALGRILILNAAAEKMFGCVSVEAMGQPMARFLPGWESSGRGIDPSVWDEKDRQRCAIPVEMRGIRSDGRELPVEVSISEVKGTDETFYSVVLRDITERQRGEEERKRVASLLLSTLESTADGILVVDLNERITRYNTRFMEMWQIPVEIMETQEYSIILSYMMEGLLHPEEFLSRSRKLYGPSGAERFDVIAFKDGRMFERLSQPQMLEGEVVGRVSSFRDITERKRAEDRLHYMALHDALTGLPNRTLLHERLNQAVVFAQRNKRQVALLFLDLDRFKLINDTLGHAIGDLLLQAVSERLKRCVRRSSTIARLGGDEFVVILANMRHIDDTAKVARKILVALSHPFYLASHELFVTTSIGIALYPSDGDDLALLLKNADTAMYRAKEEGKNGYQFFAKEMNVAAMRRLSMENAMRHGIDLGEFVVQYQPQVDLKTGQIVGVEALLRWQKERVLLLPAQFMSMACETGLIAPIGEMVLRTACAQNEAWQELGIGPIPVAVNLSLQQFKQRNLTETITGILKETGLDPCCLVVEIDEEVVVHGDNMTLDTLRRLKDIGILIALGEFGAGYASLSTLKRFPVDILKMGRAFVQNMTQDTTDAAMAMAIVTLAQILKMKVIAEGVETEEQLKMLKFLMCDAVQGNLVCGPMHPLYLTPQLQEGSYPILTRG